MWDQGAVARQFKEKGIIVIDGIAQTIQDKGKTIEQVIPFDDSKIEEDIINLPVDDFSLEDGKAVVYTSKLGFVETRKGLEAQSYHFVEADMHYIADNEITLSPEDHEKLQHLVETLEADEDVDTVYHNAK